MASGFLDLVNERVVVYDGATGTFLQGLDLTADDFGGPDLEGCNEILVATRPDAIRQFHAAYLDVGCDVVETDTFGAFAIPLGEYGLADRTHELNVTAARLAQEVAADYSTPDRPRFVAGSVGPGHEDAVTRAHRLRRSARRLPGPDGRPARGRRRPPDHRDPVRPARAQGGHDRRPPGHGRPGP